MLSAERQARVSRRDVCDAEVYAFLLWTQWLFGYALPLRHTVVLNLDETAVPYQLTGLYGNVVPVRARSAASSLLYERVSRRSMRGHLTVVSVISADATLQRCVPQFILPKDASLSNMEKGMLLELPSPIHYVSGTGGWVTSVIMKGLLTVLRRAVRSVRPEHHIVVALDAANQHIAADVLAHAARLQVHLLLIPARMTHLLQPLDSHVFGCFEGPTVQTFEASASVQCLGAHMQALAGKRGTIWKFTDCSAEPAWSPHPALGMGPVHRPCTGIGPVASGHAPAWGPL